MKAWFYALITNVKPYMSNVKWTKLNHNETLRRWKDSHIERLEKEDPFAFHLCLFMNSYLSSNLKSHNLFWETHLGKGLWDHINKINLSLIRGHESIIIKENLSYLKRITTLEFFFWCDETWCDSSLFMYFMWDVK